MTLNFEQEYCDCCGSQLEGGQIGMCDDCQKMRPTTIRSILKAPKVGLEMRVTDPQSPESRNRPESDMITKILIWMRGWRLDLDGWYVRARREVDPDLSAISRSDLGFIEEACIDVRSPVIAKQIDAGKLPAL